MATKASINARRTRAIERIQAVGEAIAEKLGLQFPAIPTRNKDEDLLQAEQLEVMQAFLEQIAASLSGSKASKVRRAWREMNKTPDTENKEAGDDADQRPVE